MGILGIFLTATETGNTVEETWKEFKTEHCKLRFADKAHHILHYMISA